MRVAKELVIEPAQSWARLQELKNSEWFIHDLEEQLKRTPSAFPRGADALRASAASGRGAV